MLPITKWPGTVHETRRIPEAVDRAFRQAFEGRPGPVYLDLPGDVILSSVDEDEVAWTASMPGVGQSRPYPDPCAVEHAIEVLGRASRPVLISGTGVQWSGAAQQLRAFVEAT